MGIKSPKVRRQERRSISVDGVDYEVEIREIPFREGVELFCEVGGEEVRVSDRGLGEHEALRIMEDEIRRVKAVFGL